MRPQGKAATARDDLRRRITTGEYNPGDQLPGVRDLMRTYGISSSSTMDRVIAALANEGLIVSRGGGRSGGLYVRRRHVVRRDLIAGLRLEHQRALAGEPVHGGLFEAMTGFSDVTVDVTYQTMGAPARVAELLGLEPDAPVLRRTYRYAIAATPHQVASSYLPAETALRARLFGPGDERVGHGTITHLHRCGITVDRVGGTIDGRPPTAAEVEELALLPGTHVFELWRVMFAAGSPVEASTSVVPQDRVSYQITVDLGGAS